MSTDPDALEIAYSALALCELGTDENETALFGLSEAEGMPYLAGIQQVGGKWRKAQPLPYRGPRLKQIVAVHGSPDAMVLGIDHDGHLYLAAWYLPNVGWKRGPSGPLVKGTPASVVLEEIWVNDPANNTDVHLYARTTTGDLVLFTQSNAATSGPQGWSYFGTLSSGTHYRQLLLIGLDGGEQVVGLRGTGGRAYNVGTYSDASGWSANETPITAEGVSLSSMAVGAGQNDGSEAVQLLGVTTDHNVELVAWLWNGTWQTASVPFDTNHVHQYDAVVATIVMNQPKLFILARNLKGALFVLGVQQATGTWTIHDPPLAPDMRGNTYKSILLTGLRNCVVGLAQDTGTPYEILRPDSSGGADPWLPGAPIPSFNSVTPTLRFGKFSGKDPSSHDVLSVTSVGALSFGASGELGYLYPRTDDDHAGKPMRLHFAATSQIRAYSGGRDTFLSADVDISSGWKDAALAELLLGGVANQDEQALTTLFSPATAQVSDATFFVWTSSLDNRIYAAYKTTASNWSPLLELFIDEDDDGNGTTHLTSKIAPAAYTLDGDALVILAPASDGALGFHVFDPAQIAYSLRDRSEDVFVTYHDSSDKPKPGRATWVRSGYRELPKDYLHTLPSDGDLQALACAPSTVLGKQALLALSVVWKKARRDFLLRLDTSALPAYGSDGKLRHTNPISDIPATSHQELVSLLQIPGNQIRMLFHPDSNAKIGVRYLDPGVTIEGGELHLAPAWVHNNCDPGMELPEPIRPLGHAGIAQAVVYTEPYIDPWSDPQDTDAATFRNAFGVVISDVTQPHRSTLYAARRLGTAVQSSSLLEMGAMDTVVTGIMDGPLPVPNTNIDALTGGWLGSQVAKLTLGSTKIGSKTHSVDKYALTGFSTEDSFSLGAQVTFSSIPGTPAVSFTKSIIAKASFLGGATHAWSRSLERQRKSNYMAFASLEPDGERSKIMSQGVMFGEGPTLRKVVFKFWNACGVLVSPDHYSVLLAEGPVARTAQITPVLATDPGDLDSYTKEKINEKMRSARARLEGRPEQALFAKKEYDDYFKEVVEKNAVKLASGRRYLELAWSGGGELEEVSDIIAEDVKSAGYTGTWKWSAGVSIEANIKAAVTIGVGKIERSAGFKLQALAEWERHKSEADTVSQKVDFGFTADLGPLRAGVNPGDTESYTVRVYLLKPSTRWVKELIHMGGVTGLNPTSRPWKVMYTVPFKTSVK